jgi:hypothetical protein
MPYLQEALRSLIWCFEWVGVHQPAFFVLPQGHDSEHTNHSFLFVRHNMQGMLFA